MQRNVKKTLHTTRYTKTQGSQILFFTDALAAGFFPKEIFKQKWVYQLQSRFCSSEEDNAEDTST